MPVRRLAAALTGLALLIPATIPAAAASAHDPGQVVTMPVDQALAQLPVRPEDRTGYTRDKFRHWIDEDGDGCTTRAEVLLEEATVAPVRTGRCTLTDGEWYSRYDDRVIAGPMGLDVDHLVPLAESWDSGASSWTAKEREAFANDLYDSRDLIAVSAASNRSKADQDPATWLPPAVGYRCTYVTDWITDKTRWGLSVDQAEAEALRRLLDGCPDAVVTVEYAR